MNKRFIGYAAAIFAALGFVNAQGQTYSLSKIGGLGGTNTYATSINNFGQVVGNSTTTDGTTHAFIYSNGFTQDLGTLGGNNSSATAINAYGQVTGSADIAGNTGQHAFIYNNGIMQDLGTLGGGNSYGNAINNNGQVTGSSDNTAFIYANGVMTSLGLPGSGVAINNLGQVAGSFLSSDRHIVCSGACSSNLGQNSHAFIYTPGQGTRDLGTYNNISYASALNNLGQVVGSTTTCNCQDMPGVNSWSAFVSNDISTSIFQKVTYGVDINDAGQAVGYSLGWYGDVGQPILYDPSSGGSSLPMLGQALSINSSGEIVGQQIEQRGYSTSHAFLFSNGANYNLNDLINPSSPLALYVRLTQATKITDSGYILAQGTDSRDNSSNWYLLAPPTVPIPASVWMLFSGIGGLGLLARKRKGAK